MNSSWSKFEYLTEERLTIASSSTVRIDDSRTKLFWIPHDNNPLNPWTSRRQKELCFGALTPFIKHKSGERLVLKYSLQCRRTNTIQGTKDDRSIGQQFPLASQTL
mmetsp:Transcript_122557/g.352144  ORF Transcript_122557/g.352144 Transcript_122557/m.352144 type:complete len:106 (+) Transcript_122557:69-386(+)